MKKPTEKQIKSEIKKLEKMKPAVRRSNIFGDDHHLAIDAQIHVLKEHLDLDDVDQRYGDGPENVRENAEFAAQWLDGEADEEYKTISEIWESLLVK